MLSKKFLSVFTNRHCEEYSSEAINKPVTPPIWIMRQAGRYLPEYRAIRETLGGFLDLCYNPKFAAEVTLQPIKRFDFDAAIIFSDILIIPHSLGLDVRFEQGEGPRVERILDAKDLVKLKVNPGDEKLQRVYEAISLVKASLPTDKTLIGFVGSPWTVATYILEGRGKHDFAFSRKIAYQNPDFLSDLIKIITQQTVSHIVGQVKAGAEVIQLFDSWSGVLPESEYRKFVIEPTIEIVREIKKLHPNVPLIGFPRGSGFLYESYIDETMVDGIGIDQNVPLKTMTSFQKKVVVQGNLDPVVLLTNKDVIGKKVDEIMGSVSKENFIFNLGHGILPETPIENVEFLVEYIRSKV